MKKPSAIRGIMWGVAGVLAVLLLIERQAWSKLAQRDVGLRQNLSPLDSIIEENRRLSNLLAQANGVAPLPNEKFGESQLKNDDRDVLRLRTEVDSLRQQIKEIEALREDTCDTRAALENLLKAQSIEMSRKPRERTTPSGSRLEIVRAEYWTENTRINVTDELQDRIRGDSLKAVASNNIKGDPDLAK